MNRRTVITGLAVTPLAVADPAHAFPAQRVSASSRKGATLVIGHRGASGYRPEHTLASYELAARMGADFIEPDVVITRDGVLVCRHEPEIGGTTDVASRPEFADRKTTKKLDGANVTGWWAEDFTLAELKTLYAAERLPGVRQENTMYNGRLRVPTLDEAFQLRAELSRRLGRRIGIYPETKHPTYFQELGLPLEKRLLGLVRKHGLNHADAPIFVQSFETTNLQQLRRMGLRAPAVQLLSATGAPYDLVAAGDPRTYADLITPKGLGAIARYAQGLGPDKSLVIPRTAAGALGSPTALVDNAHAQGLLVHPYTFRAENTFLPADYRSSGGENDFGKAIDEQITFLATGIDGLFTDQPDVGVFARSERAAA
ncbi:glycerophosphodiester phosphodiesterase [Kineosporia sp. NBRC 101731]|uniref:glycerophosphodiester phosphodiesterase n=1 Tax=Kineosporia sp. NBRC 101731 TaxID=3032199 RepID=UPI0024A20FFC|nr:glycerophosphodiester phosphodiesterase [Kineosporia sp. NBRC 101731]GLY27771.1 glycerophosphoryl diester phosphodiesterase [Kineosporia sp. NBRC 101731]